MGFILWSLVDVIIRCNGSDKEEVFCRECCGGGMLCREYLVVCFGKLCECKILCRVLYDDGFGSFCIML